MGSLVSENLHALSKLDRVVNKLLKGKETAILLQTRLRDPVQVHGSVSDQELVLQILGSFTESISELSSCSDSADSEQIVSACSGESKKRLVGGKDRRGCYKRRKTSDSRTVVSSTLADDFAWRKYGQKTILKSEFPRCYFRCTHKYEGCKAQKQVQKIQEDPILFQITYFNQHTCTNKIRAPPLIVDNDYSDPNGRPVKLLSFQVNHQDSTFGQEQNNVKKSTIVLDSVKIEEESKEDIQSTDDLYEAKSSSSTDPWANIISGSGLTGSYMPIWDPNPNPIMSSYQEVGSDFLSNNSGSTSFHGFDFEVDQFDGIDDFPLDELC